VQRLLAVEEIKQLKARYFRFLDTKDWAGLASVFTADAVLEAEGRAREGADNIVGFVAKFLEGAVSVHHGHMPEITITGPDSATGVWAMFDYLQLPTEPPSELRGYGHYHEEYVREDGVWRIRRLVLTRLRVDRGSLGER